METAESAPRPYGITILTGQNYNDQISFTVESVREWCADTYAVNVNWSYRCTSAEMTAAEAMALGEALIAAAKAASGQSC